MSAGCWFGSCGGHFDTVDEVTDNCHGGSGGGWWKWVVGRQASDVTN